MTLPGSDSPRVLRVWHQIRSRHLEDLRQMAPGLTVYQVRSYDFHAELADGLEVRRAGTLRTAWLIAFARYDLLELNEPTIVILWPRHLIYALALRLRRSVRRVATPAVCYAIDNFEFLPAIGARCGRLGKPARAFARAVFGLLLGSLDRIAFGTTSAADAYATAGGRVLDGIEHTVIPAADPACPCADPDAKVHGRVAFVGALEERKGVTPLLQAWDRLPAGSELLIAGKGPMAERVLQWAASRPAVTVLIDPSREQIHEALRLASVTVLLSQSVGFWREQLGLPLLEALSHGCTVVASTETGIADWLAEMGHLVLPPDVPPCALADQLAARLTYPLDPRSVLGQLPQLRSRVQADRWLTRQR